MRRPLWQKVCPNIPFESSLAFGVWRTVNATRLSNIDVMEGAPNHQFPVCVSQALVSVPLQVCNKESACDTATGGQPLSPQQW